MQLQSKGFIKIHYDLVVVGNLEKEQSWWTQSPPSRNWQISKCFCFSARKTQKKRGRKLLLGSEVSEDRQLAPQFVILVVRLSKENNNNQDQQGIKMDVSPIRGDAMSKLAGFHQDIAKKRLHLKYLTLLFRNRHFIYLRWLFAGVPSVFRHPWVLTTQVDVVTKLRTIGVMVWRTTLPLFCILCWWFCDALWHEPW